MASPFPEFPVHEHTFYVRETKPNQDKDKVWNFLEYNMDNGRQQPVKVIVNKRQPARDESEPEDLNVELLRKIRDKTIKHGDEVIITGSIVFNAYYFTSTKTMRHTPTLRIKSFRAGRPSYLVTEKHPSLGTVDSGAPRGQPSFSQDQGSTTWHIFATVARTSPQNIIRPGSLIMDLTVDNDDTIAIPEEDSEVEELLVDNRRSRKRQRTNKNQPMTAAVDAPAVAKTAKTAKREGQCSNSSSHSSAKPSTTLRAQTQKAHSAPPPSRYPATQ